MLERIKKIMYLEMAEICFKLTSHHIAKSNKHIAKANILLEKGKKLLVMGKKVE